MTRYLLTWTRTTDLRAAVVADSMREALALIDDPDVQRAAETVGDRDSRASVEENDRG